MADAIAAFKKAVRIEAAKDLRRVGRWLITLANRLDPPPLLRLVRDLGRLADLVPKTEHRPTLAPGSIPGLGEAITAAMDAQLRERARECGQIVYAQEHGWGQIAKKGGTCHLPRGHDGEHEPT